MPYKAAFAGLLLLAPLTVTAEPRFSPVPLPEHIYSGGWEHFVGGGVAVFDCNGDDLPEAFLAGGSAPAMLLKNTTKGHGAAIRFEKATPKSLALEGVTGAYPLDIDGDGTLDLAVLRVGENRLMRGLGNCRFEPMGKAFGFESDPEGWTTAFSATWEEGATLPTLAFGNYVDRADPKGPFGTCAPGALYRQDGAGYGTPLPLAPAYCPLSMLFSDWSRTGRQDLRVSNDRHYYVKGGQEQLWAMEPTPRLYTEEDGWKPYALWGMGIATRDMTGDGRQEVYLTSMGDQKFQALAEGAQGPVYEDAHFDSGTTAHRPYVGDDGRPSTGWHVAFGDVQNDGRDDIFVAKGNVEQMPGAAMEDPNNLLVQQADGRFTEHGATAGIATVERSRGAALVDLNLDGLLDLIVVNRRAAAEAYQNTSDAPGNWAMVALRHPAPNTRAVGAFAEIRAGGRTHLREITVGGGHAGGDAVPLHIGLGMATQADLRVIWPDGAVSDWVDLPVNALTRVTRNGADAALLLAPGG
ncbi:CRTAC1 family protein [Pseudoruegeria sp. SHC-113]|uniref:CRTAC1 family protein n=1 Tax=Pseudoruegeria sp. SHC-113 TaxID=2855439 RepID=UPI0021BA9A64|nr:CRTAC1 family protein [Pseudoruegeria sp. SHC-113]MCT8161782.1 CRTAC1 family protein [Pseudoruegeria sp. SHC-113]